METPQSGADVTCLADTAVNIETFGGATDVSITIGDGANSVTVEGANPFATIEFDAGGSNTLTVAQNALLQNAFAGQSTVFLNGSDSNGVTNNGQITSSNFVAINVAGDANEIVNNGTVLGGIRAIVIGGDGNSIINNVPGVIASGGDIAVSFSNFAGFQNSLVNHGTILGDVVGGSGNETITNFGLIDGGVFLGSGNDTFAMGSSSIVTGGVDAQGGFDILALVAPDEPVGPGLFDLSTIGNGFSGFDLISQSDSNWVLIGSTNALTVFSAAGDGGLRLFGADAANAIFYVQNGGTISGNGSVGEINVLIGGAISPGGDGEIAQINAESAFFHAQSTGYYVHVAPGGTSDLILVNGPVVINGGTVFVSPTAAWGYTPGTQYTILTSTSSVTGAFADLQLVDLPLISGVLTYDNNNVYFELLEALGFGDVAQTPNQLAVADALDASLTGGTASSELEAIASQLVTLPTDAALLAGLDDLTGQVNADARRFTTRVGADFHRFVQRSARELGPDQRAWAGLYRNHSDVDSTADTFGRDGATIGGAMGFRAPVGDGGYLGAAAGFSDGEMEGAHGADEADVTAFHIAGYGMHSIGDLQLSVQTSLGWADVSVSRSTALPDADLSGDTEAFLIDASFEAAYAFHLAEGVSLSPYAALERFESRHSGYVEEGAPGINLIVARGEDRSTQTSFGARLNIERDDLLFHVDLAQRTIIDGEAPDFRGAFDGDPSSGFKIVGAAEPDQAFAAGLSTRWRVGGQSWLTLGYNGVFADEGGDQSLQASFDLRF